jgi:hypothetical protein
LARDFLSPHFHFSPFGFAPEGLFLFAVVPFGPAAFFVASSFAPSATTEDRPIFLLRAIAASAYAEATADTTEDKPCAAGVARDSQNTQHKEKSR